MLLPIINRLKTCFSTFHTDKSGIAVAYVAIAIPVLIGFGLLAIDVGRMSTLQSSLQHGADALALAGAAELDRSPDSITRANTAIANLVTTNKSLFATTVVTINSSDVTTCYMPTIPASDSTAIAAGSCFANTSANAQLTHYVQVKVNAANFSTVFPVSYFGAANNNSTSTAEAVAGFDAAVCNFTPMFMCNPLESANNSSLTDDFGLAAMASDYSTRRKIIRFLAFSGGNNVPAVSGQFGFLNVSGGGANALGDEIASQAPPECYILNTLKTKTGSMNSLRTAFNTRFDMYTNANNTGSYTATAYPPGVNVRKGYIPPNGNGNSSICNATAGTAATNPIPSPVTTLAPKVMAFPIDSCFKTNTCAASSGNANVGNGDWGWDPDNGSTNVAFRDVGTTKAGYWDRNFIGTSGATATLPTPPNGGTYSNGNLPSRYDIYRYEISSGYYNRYSVTGGTANTGAAVETGVAKCAASNNVNPVDTSIGTGGVDRRVLYGAIMNCAANGLQPGSNGVYHALAFGKFFMVRPIDSTDTLWTELIGLVYPGDGTGVARDRVQLYR